MSLQFDAAVFSCNFAEGRGLKTQSEVRRLFRSQAAGADAAMLLSNEETREQSVEKNKLSLFLSYSILLDLLYQYA